MIRWAAGLVWLAVAAQAETVPLWEGYWSPNANWCDRAGDVGEETPDFYGRTGLFGLEWSCDIEAVTPTGLANAWTLSQTCLDAGYSYGNTQIFLVTPDDRLLIIGETGVQANMVRCHMKRE